MKFYIFTIILLILNSNEILACSAFFSAGETKYFGKNFDWGSGQGYIIKNISGQNKFAYGLRGNNQINWTSKFGSITFNQIGKEFPYGGINENGLVVEQLWMSESIYQDNKNKTISELEWIQYQLDNYSSIDEIIKNINNLTIKPIATVHYFIADRNGNSAVIDFVEGKTAVNRKQGKNQVITNETYLNSEKYFQLNQSIIDKASRTHFDRFCQIKNSLSNINIESPYQAFEILNNSSENNENYKTYWTIVYDLSNLKIYFKSFDNKIIKKINFSEINFSSNIEASNINQDILKFDNYTYEMNEQLFSASIKMMNLNMDLKLGATHQMTPNLNRIDQIYQDNYTDLTITFISKTPKGIIYYTIMNNEEDFKVRKGIRSGLFSTNKKENIKVMYGMQKGEFVLACFQDTDYNNEIDTKIFGIPKNYGFSRNHRGVFGTPPKYQDAKIDLQSDTEIIIKIK
jgi:choloylglycine hydrolase